MVATAAGYSPSVPGFTAERNSVEAGFLFQTFFQGDVVFDPLPIIDSGSTDAGGSPTTTLRPGLLMGKIAASGLWAPYSPLATDGTQEARGILVTECNMLDFTTGAAAYRLEMGLVIKGKIKASQVLNLDYQARNQLASRGFTFDDDAWGVRGGYRRVVSKAADYTVLASDHLTLFLATAAANFTLPTIAPGLSFEFLNTADVAMTVTSAEGDNIITDNDASADSIAFSTSSHKIGGRVQLDAIYVGSTLKWIPTFKSASTNTISIAT